MRYLKIAIPVLFVLFGVGLVLYPFVSETVYENRVDGEIEIYKEQAEEKDDREALEILLKAQEYNEKLAQEKVVLTDPFEAVSDSGEVMGYSDVLDTDGNGLMGFIRIPKIKVSLPIFHGTGETVLLAGAGHLERTSFPIGGENTHAALSAHTGINSAKMFTDLPQLVDGDYFFIDVLKETLAYQVINIQTVLPENVSSLSIQDGEDLVTLITCTPYGINSHRLLVTGKRSEYTEELEVQEEEKAAVVTGKSEWMVTYKKAILFGFGVGLATILVLLTAERILRKKEAGDEEDTITWT